MNDEQVGHEPWPNTPGARERDREIARRAVAGVYEHPTFPNTVAAHRLLRFILAAITEAKQEQREEAVSLLRAWVMHFAGHMRSEYPQLLKETRQFIAAKGVQPAAKCPKCGHAPHGDICYNMASDSGCECSTPAVKPSEILQHVCAGCGSMCHGPAAKQEGAPAVEQKERERQNNAVITEASTCCAGHLAQDDVIKQSDKERVARRIRTYMKTACQAWRKPAPSPAQEKPETSSKEWNRSRTIEYIEALPDNQLAEVWCYAERQFGYKTQSQRRALRTGAKD